MKIYPDDVLGYYGMLCYLDDKFMSTDKLNKNLYKELTIEKACISTYKCRFSGQEKEYLKFKTEQDAFDFAEKLVHNYGDTFMTLIGFHLDAKVNLAGNTGWDKIDTLHKGI